MRGGDQDEGTHLAPGESRGDQARQDMRAQLEALIDKQQAKRGVG
jgi:hypothetical protein